MHKVLGASVGVGVLIIAAGLGALLLGHREASPAVEPRSTPQAVAPVPSPPPPVPSLPPKEEDTPPVGATHIQGVVIGAMGPIPGARVTATYTVSGQTLSTLTCGNLSKSHEDARPFTQCASDVAGAVLEHILAREGAAQGQAETDSNEDGTFKLSHVSTDTVTLWVAGPHVAAMWPDVRRGTEGLQLQLAAGMYLEGQVVDEGGKPQVGARVTAMHLGTTRFFDTRTREGGHYRLGPLPKAEYVLAYAMDGRMPTLRDQEQARQRPVVLLTPRRLQGRVSSGGAPVPNATVLLNHHTVQGKARWEVVSPPQKQVTDAHGRFHFEELTPHRFALSVSHDGQHAIEDVDLGSPHPAPEVDLKLGTALLLDGQVRNEEGFLLGLATASLRSHRGETVKRLQHQGPHERYQIGPLKPGAYHLTVSAPGYRSIEYPARKLALGQGPLDVTLERSTDILPPGEVELSVDKTGFRFDPPRSSGGKPGGQGLRVQAGNPDERRVVVPSGVARGRVLAPDGTPLARFQVLDEDVVSPQGTFIVPREAVGKGDIRIAAPGMTTVTRRAVFRRETDVVDLGDIRMTPGRRVVGRVLDATTSEPIFGAVVIPSREPLHEALDREFHRPGATRTDPKGAFELVRVDETPLLLHVEADGYLRQQRVLSPRMEEDLTIRLEKPSLVKVNVIDSKGQPGVADIFFDREGGDLDLIRDPVRMADKDWGVQVELEPGTYRVQAMGTGYTPDRFAPQRIQVPRGGSIHLTLRALREGATLQLDVTNGVPRLTYLLPLGRPFSPSMLDERFSLRGRALPEDRGTSGTTQTFHRLPPGKLTLLVVEFNGRGYHVEELDIPARGTVKRTVTPVWRPHVLPH